MNYLYFLFTYAGPFIALSLLYLLWAYTAFRWQETSPNYYKWVCKVNEWLPKIIVSILVFGFISYLLGVF